MHPVWGLAILATVLTAGYLLWAWQRAFLGVNPTTAAYPDVSAREGAVLFPLVGLCLALGGLPISPRLMRSISAPSASSPHTRPSSGARKRPSPCSPETEPPQRATRSM